MAEASASEIRNRVKELRNMAAADLQDNDGNWRTHPQFQRDALAGLLVEVGIAGALIAYESERQGGLTLINGHMRWRDYPDIDWPVLVLDVDDAEADLLLASLDPLAAMAQADAGRQAALLASINDPLDGVLDIMQAEAEAEAALMAEITAALEGGVVGSGPVLTDRKKLIKPVLYVEDVSIFERAIHATGLRNRGEAIVEICRYYLGENETEG